MKVIAFTGLPFSGKSEAVSLAKNHNIPVIRMGDIVWDEVKKKGLTLSSENVGCIANKTRQEEGKDIWAKKTIKKINLLPNSSCIVIDGVRNCEEIEQFKLEFGVDFLLVAIIASDNIRHKRALSRGRIDDSAKIEDIKKRDEREIQWGIQKVIEKADISFTNEGDLSSFHVKIYAFFNSI